MNLIGLALAALIGISLGLLGAGGSILAVPILVYAVGMSAKPAIATSLLVVGTTSLVGALRHWKAANVDFGIAVLFGLVSMGGSYAGGRLAAGVSDTFQLVLFALVMIAASISMFRRDGGEPEAGAGAVHPLLVAGSALCVGMLTGFVGVGGGFLIVPALVVLAGTPMRRAVGTSLLVIAMNSAAGFAAYAGMVAIDWGYTVLFTVLAVVGVLIGSSVVARVSPRALRRGFAVFLLGVATLILAESLRPASPVQIPHASPTGSSR